MRLTVRFFWRVWAFGFWSNVCYVGDWYLWIGPLSVAWS